MGYLSAAIILADNPLLFLLYRKFRLFVAQRKAYIHRTYVRKICVLGIQNRRVKVLEDIKAFFSKAVIEWVIFI